MGNYSRTGSSNLVRPPEVVAPHEHDINDLPVGRGPFKLALWEDMADGFLAPNEFYVDVGHTPIDSRSRHVPTVAEAFERADLLFAAGVDIVIRLREGQTHFYPDQTTLTRNVTFYSEGNPQGEIVGASAGVLDLTDAIFLRPATTREVAFNGAIIRGNFAVFQEFHRISFDSCTLRGLRLNVSSSGVAGNFALNMVNCTGQTSDFATTHPFELDTTNTAGPQWSVSLQRCTFNADLTDALSRSLIEAEGTAIDIVNCTLNFTADSAVATALTGLGSSGAAPDRSVYTLTDTTINWSNPTAIQVIFSGKGGGAVAPEVIFRGRCAIWCPDQIAFNLGDLTTMGNPTAAPEVYLTSPGLTAMPDALYYGAVIHTRAANKRGPPYQFTYEPALIGDPALDNPIFGQTIPGQFLEGSTSPGTPTDTLEPRYGTARLSYDDRTAIQYRVKLIGTTVAGGALETSSWVIEGAASVTGGVLNKIGAETFTVLVDQVGGAPGTVAVAVLAVGDSLVVSVNQGATATSVGWKAYIEQFVF